MKKFLGALCLLLFSAVQLHAIIILNPSRVQKQYRWRNDDGNQTAATWKAAENTPIVITAADIVRLRMELANTGLGAGAITQTLEYSSNNGTTWTVMNTPATDAFVYQASTFVANGANTTQQMSNTTAGTFAAGRVVTAPGTAVNLAAAGKTEYEWCIKPTANALPSTTYIFRSTGQDATPTVFPTLTMACSGTPTAGTVSAAANPVTCNTATTLSLIGNTSGPGINYQWQRFSNGVWVDFGTNSDNQVTPVIVQDTKFRCIVRCISGGLDSTETFIVSPTPLDVNLGEDINECINEGELIVLDAGNHPNSPSFLWNDNSTGQAKAIGESGTYFVTVTDIFTCKGSDTIHVILRKFPEVNLGNDTTICNGVTLTLTSGSDGIQYFWNTGQTGQTINVNTPGSYNVFVTNNQGCVGTDTIQVDMNGELPTIQDIYVSNNGQRTFKFKAVNPQNVIGYEWNFGDGSAASYEAEPEHTYANAGIYIVTLRLSSSCGFTDDSIGAHIVGIQQINVTNDELSVFPNPSNGRVTILNNGGLKMTKVEVYNLLGQIVHQSETRTTLKQTLDLSNKLASGTYVMEIYTDKGVVTRKITITE